MPNIFKALASVTAWTLFIVSWVTALCTLMAGITSGILFSTTEAPPMIFPAFLALALAQGIGAVVVMVLRKKME